jgi:hypothetical protein
VDVGINMMMLPVSADSTPRLQLLKVSLVLDSERALLTHSQVNAAIFLLSLLEGAVDMQAPSHMLAVLDFSLVVRPRHALALDSPDRRSALQGGRNL